MSDEIDVNRLAARFLESPDDADVREELAVYLLDAGRFDDLDRIANEVLSRHPGHVPTLGILASTMRARGQKAEAAAFLERAWSLDPSSFDLGYWASSVYEELDDTPAGLRLLHAMLAVRDDAEVRTKLSGLYRKIDDYEKAIEHGRRAVELDPENPWALGFLSSALFNAGNGVEARAVLRRAVGHPDAPPWLLDYAEELGVREAPMTEAQYEAWLRRVNTFAREEGYETAMTFVRRGATGDPDPRIRLKLVSMMNDIGWEDEAEELLLSIGWEVSPSDRKAKKRLTAAIAEFQRFDKAHRAAGEVPPPPPPGTIPRPAQTFNYKAISIHQDESGEQVVTQSEGVLPVGEAPPGGAKSRG